MCEHWYPVILAETGKRTGTWLNPECAEWILPIMRANGLEIEMPVRLENGMARLRRRPRRLHKWAFRLLRWLFSAEGLVALWAVAICVGVWFGTSVVGQAVARQAR